MAEPWQATLSGVVMDGTEDASGCVWGVEEIVGWDSAEVRAPRSNRTAGDGSWGPVRRFGGRQLTVKGWVDCPSMAVAFATRDSLPTLTEGTLIREEDVVKQLTVTQSGEIRATDPIPGADIVTVEFQIPVVADYPFKRALTPVTQVVTAGSSPTFTATGKSPAEIEVTLTSAGTVDLTLNGQRLRTGSLPSGAVLTSGFGFTNPKRTIRSSTGSNLFGLIQQPMQWPAVIPGANSANQAGTANLSIKYFPTFA